MTIPLMYAKHPTLEYVGRVISYPEVMKLIVGTSINKKNLWECSLPREREAHKFHGQSSIVHKRNMLLAMVIFLAIKDGWSPIEWSDVRETEFIEFIMVPSVAVTCSNKPNALWKLKI